MTTAGNLTKGSRVFVTGAPGPFVTLAKTEEGATVATVTADPTKDGRKLVFATTEGVLTAGPTAKVLLAPGSAEEAPEDAPAVPATPDAEEAPEDALPAPAGVVVASVNLNAAGRLTAESVVSVPGGSTAVPAGANAPARLAAALAELGYEPIGRWAVPEQGRAVCQVRPTHPA
ncbi:hypothetical protein ACFWDN_21380 [Micromonospora chalcea]